MQGLVDDRLQKGVQLAEIAPGLFAAEDWIEVRRILRMPRRMVVFRGPSGLVVWSPNPATPGLMEQVRALGEPRALVAPNLKHDRFLGPWLEAFPEADFWAPAGFVAADGPLPRAPQPLARARWPEGLSALPIEGIPELAEQVLIHGPSRSLVTADLIFNIHEAPGVLSRAIHRLNDSWRKAGPSRFLRGMVRDRAALQRSLQRLLEADFDRLVPGHGRVIECGGKDVLRSGYAWL